MQLIFKKKFFQEDWENVEGLRIRIAMHAGFAEKRGNDYYGTDVNKTARILSTGWGGQILITEEVIKNFNLPENTQVIDLGVHKLKDLSGFQRIYQLIHSDIPLKKFPPLNSLSSYPNNLPIQSTPFVGRKKEISEIIEILKEPECRVLTITGPGGVGKTRIAIQAGAEIIEEFPDGAFLVPLELLNTKELIAGKIADSIGFNFYSRDEPTIQIINYLREKNMLLIMDNFEHIIEGADIVSRILKNTENVKFLITSREILKIQGEWNYDLKGFGYPGDDAKFEEYDGVKLFVNGVRRAKPDFRLSDDDKYWIIRICRMVQGLPLAIEIASAWIKVLSCREIAEEIQKNIDFLTTSLRDVPERHRSLRAVFDYSWELLKENEKRALKYLSIFRGGFTRESAEKVANVDLNLLLSLIEKSLIKKENSKYSMLNLTLRYAEKKLRQNLEEYKFIKQRYVDYYSDFIEEKKIYMRTPEQKEKFYKPLTEEIENIRDVWEYAIENKFVDKIEKFIEPLHFFYSERSRYQEGKLIFEMAESKLRDLQGKDGLLLYSKILARLGSFYLSMGFYKEAKEHFERGLKVFKKFNLKKEIVMVYRKLGLIFHYLGDYKKSEEFFEKALKIAKELNDKYEISGVMNNIGLIYLQIQEYDRAKELFEGSLEIWKEVNYKKGIALSLGNLGLIYHYKGDYQKADEFLRRSLELEIELENMVGIARVYYNIGLNYKHMGNYREAKKHYEKALEIERNTGDRMGVAISLNALADLKLEQGDYSQAEDISIKALELSREMGNAVSEAEALYNLGEDLIQKGEPDRGIEYIYCALKKALELNLVYIRYGLFSSAHFFIMKEDYETAFKILIYLKENYEKEFKEKIDKKIEELKPAPGILKKISKEVSNKNLRDFTEDIIKKISIYLKDSV